ncbi:MAG: SusD/RagB family nutrient-binding outer membrane lipoprotein, partial [Mucilaginibacter sp.]|nr:SusD/RagB family nutrient-binding outer membrane lipoprotein [Mucilaginibacter sp.]
YLDETVDAESNPGYSNVAGKQNPFYAAYGFDPSGNPTGVYWRANNFAVTAMKNLNDTLRLVQMYSLAVSVDSPATAKPTVVRGNIFGDPKAKSNTYTSGVGPGLLKTAASNSVLFSGAESLFLQAEAVNKGFLTSTATAQSLYERGITASFLALGLKATDAATYFAQPLNNVNWVASTDKEVAIITQKWIALNGYFNNEAWNEYRRTGYPVHPSTIDPASVSTTGTYPTRILYPLSELNTNATNLGKEGTIDVFNTKIFWAK